MMTGDNALLLTAFALAFSPVSPLSENDGKTTEFAPLILFSPREPLFRRRVRGSQGVAVAAHVRRRDGKFYLDGGANTLTSRGSFVRFLPR